MSSAQAADPDGLVHLRIDQRRHDAQHHDGEDARCTALYAPCRVWPSTAPSPARIGDVAGLFEDVDLHQLPEVGLDGLIGSAFALQPVEDLLDEECARIAGRPDGEESDEPKGLQEGRG